MAAKFYVVWAGRRTGIFSDWDTCKAQVEGFAGARYKSFKTRAEAEAAHAAGPGAPAPRKQAATGKKSAGIKTWQPEEVATHPARTHIFSDGGCEPNPGKAASGLAIYRDGDLVELWYGLFNPRGTNNTAELNALHQALLAAQRELAAGRSVAVFSDSSYAIQCITRWAYGWEKKGWKKQGGEIKNLALIQEIFALHRQLGARAPLLHVNGHVGVEGNELADRMSIHGIDRKEREFVAYTGPLEIPQILAMRKG